VKELRGLQNNRNKIISEGNRPGASLWAKAKSKMTQYGLDDAAYALGGSDPRNLIRLLQGEAPIKNDGLTNTLTSANKDLRDLRAAESAKQS
jgi:hypothetical protein